MSDDPRPQQRPDQIDLLRGQRILYFVTLLHSYVRTCLIDIGVGMCIRLHFGLEYPLAQISGKRQSKTKAAQHDWVGFQVVPLSLKKENGGKTRISEFFRILHYMAIGRL